MSFSQSSFARRLTQQYAEQVALNQRLLGESGQGTGTLTRLIRLGMNVVGVSICLFFIGGGYIFNVWDDAIGIIGSADGPTAIYLDWTLYRPLVSLAILSGVVFALIFLYIILFGYSSTTKLKIVRNKLWMACASLILIKQKKNIHALCKTTQFRTCSRF